MGHTMINLIVEIAVGLGVAYFLFLWLEKQGIIDKFRKKKKPDEKEKSNEKDNQVEKKM